MTEQERDALLLRMALMLEQHGAKLDDHGAKLDDHGAKLDDHGAKLDDHGAKLQTLQESIDQVDARLSDVALAVRELGGNVPDEPPSHEESGLRTVK